MTKWYSFGEWDQPLLVTSIEAEYSLSKYFAILSPRLSGGFSVKSRIFCLDMGFFLGLKKLVEKTNYIDRYIQAHRRALAEYERFIRTHRFPAVHNDRDVLILVRRFVRTTRNFVYFFDAGILLDKIVMDKLLARFDFATASRLIKPRKKTDVNKEIEALRLLAATFRKKFGKKFDKLEASVIIKRLTRTSLLQKLIKHASRYSYLSTQAFRGEPWRLEDYIERAKAMISGNRNGNARELEALPVLDRKTKQFARKGQILNELRARRIELFNKGIWVLTPLWEYGMRKLQISKDEFINLTYQELEGALESGKLNVSRQELRLRNIAYSVLWENGKLTYHSSPPLKAGARTVKILKGLVANPGKAQGVVRLVRGTNDFTKFKKGEILVAPLTTPNFISVMAKAAAIVTDSGGITSHAAIVSRELKIPCIIGTKIATQVLRDGDLVEVDAVKGIVRIVKKA